MTVTLLAIILELPETTSIKDKRRVVVMAKEKLRRKFQVSCAEVDLNDSLGFAELGAALVSNSREFGEKVMAKAVAFVEDDLGLKIYDYQVHTETF